MGAVFGSFLTAFTYRFPRGISFFKGRSFCPKCKAKIDWYDNIPLFSYILLLGRCRHCHKKISPRYFLIELSTALGFLFLFYLYINRSFLPGGIFSSGLFFYYLNKFGIWTLPHLLLIFLCLVSIFIIDIEERIIPDEVVFFLYFLAILGILIINPPSLFLYIFTGFVSYIFFFVLYLITKGKGMGLGDAKFALFAGTFLGLTSAINWVFTSFLLGGIIGLILILFGKTKFGKKISFGPFLVIAFILELFLGPFIISILGF